MRRLPWMLLLALPLTVLLVLLAQRDPGYLLFSYGGFSIETSLWFALLSLLVLLWLLRLLQRLLRGGQRLGSWWQHRDVRRQAQRVDEGLIAFAEGQWRQAHHRLSRLGGAHHERLPLRLLAAQAAERAGDLQASQALLASIRQEGSAEDRLAADLTEARLWIDRGAPERAVALLDALGAAHPDHPARLRLLAEALLRQRAWPLLTELLPKLKKPKLLNDDELRTLERTLQCGLFSAAVAQGAAALEQQFTRLSRPLARDPQVIAAYVDALIESGAEPRAERAVREALGRDWQAALVERYGRIGGEHPDQQLATAERWLKSHPHDAILLRAVARLALRNRLWGRAQQALQASFALHPDPQTAAELARLDTALGEATTGIGHYQQALGLLAVTLPELPLPGKPPRPSSGRLPGQIDPHRT